MSGNSKSLLFLLQRCVAVRSLVSSTGIKTRSSLLTGRLSQQRSLSSLSARTVCVQRLFELQSVGRKSQISFCSKAGESCEDEYPPLPAYQSETEQKEVYIVQVKGLPWACSAQELLQFFSDCRIRDGEKGIHLTLDQMGRPTGRAFLEMQHEEDVRKALERHRQYLGPRYIEVYEVTNRDAEEIMKNDVQTAKQETAGDGVVRIRGLPFSCTEFDIEQFFSGLEIIQNGITFVSNRKGRRNGEAYVQFSSQKAADDALLRHKENIGQRYIEVFPSRSDEIRDVWGKKKSSDVPQSSPQMSNSGTVSASQSNPKTAPSRPPQRSSFSLHYIHARGLPYQVTVEEIIKFFSPYVISKIVIECAPDGYMNGEADVYFSCHRDASAAMCKNKQYIGERYIELFLNSDTGCDAR